MSDLIDRKAVIDAIHAYWLNEIKADGETDRSIKTNTRHSKNICGAIKALPPADLRTCVSHALSKEETERFRKEMKYARVGLLPPAEPQERKGKWIPHQSKYGKDGEYVYTCDKCGENIGFAKKNFCPNCGARMEVDNE